MTGRPDVQTPEQIVARFGRSLEWATEHTQFPHHCVDGKIYRASCLVSDPECHTTAVGYIHTLTWTGGRIQYVTTHGGETWRLTKGSDGYYLRGAFMGATSAAAKRNAERHIEALGARNTGGDQ